MNGADLVLPDGIGVVKGAAMLGTPLKEKTPGIEFAGHLMDRLAEEGRSLYLLGAKPGVAEQAAAKLAEAGVKNIAMHDVSSTHVSGLIGEVFRCSHLVLAAPTYNNGIYPAMLNFLHDCKALNLQNRTIGLIENGTWGPVAAKQMKEILDGLKNMNVLEPVVTLKSALNDVSMEQLEKLADAIAASLAE